MLLPAPSSLLYISLSAASRALAASTRTPSYSTLLLNCPSSARCASSLARAASNCGAQGRGGLGALALPGGPARQPQPQQPRRAQAAAPRAGGALWPLPCWHGTARGGGRHLGHASEHLCDVVVLVLADAVHPVDADGVADVALLRLVVRLAGARAREGLGG
jgi:hypothetical protein